MTAAAAEPPRESFDLRVPFAPAVYAVDGHRTLVYELQLNNYAVDTLEPTAVAVIDADRGEVLLRYEAAQLAQHLDRSGLQRPVTDSGGIASGRRGIVFVELTLAAQQRLPKQLRHRVEYRDAATGPAPAGYGAGTAPARRPLGRGL
jgi:murein DD-endopeptidase